VNGEVAEDSLMAATVHWLDRLPEQHAVVVLQDAGLSTEEAQKLVAQRPFAQAVPESVVAALLSG
jgi:hypothetical protein